MRRRYRFEGRVQGVGFRATASDIASHHAVTGWVRNERDGTVVLEAQGTPEAIEGFVSDIMKVRASNIRRSTWIVVEPVGDERGFAVRRDAPASGAETC